MADHADLARLAHVSRARISQIMNLLLLAPEIQEAILFLSRIDGKRGGIGEWVLRRICAVADWRRQRRVSAWLTRQGRGEPVRRSAGRQLTHVHPEEHG